MLVNGGRVHLDEVGLAGVQEASGEASGRISWPERGNQEEAEGVEVLWSPDDIASLPGPPGWGACGIWMCPHQKWSPLS